MRKWMVGLCLIVTGASLWAAPKNTAAPRGTYKMVEFRFEIPDLQGNPFDFRQNDVLVSLKTPDGATVKVPAFFDGGTTWRARYTPARAGRYPVYGVTRNGRGIRPSGISPRQFTVGGKAGPGFVRRAADKRTFVFDNGEPYIPFGHNVAWGDPDPLSVPRYLEKMGKAGANWARIWMDHWDGKNLDWVDKKTIPLGSLDLGSARRWDGIVDAAEKGGVRFQMALQHHGQYTTFNDSNWDQNPWNVKIGGFLASPGEFFTNPRAIAMTQAKYRYIIARWGYSPSIMAWELFNEVEWTNPVKDGHPEVVAAWHNTMAAFLRRQDPYHHLITSSSGIRTDMLGTALDYWQPHYYVPDPLDAVSRLNGQKLDRPAFIGEIGPSWDQPQGDPWFQRRVLWGSLMSEAAGAAMYWSWDFIDREGLYASYGPAAGFVRRSGLAARKGLRAASARVETDERGPLTFSPGAVWDKATQTEFSIAPSGDIPGLATLPRFLQGNAHRDMGSVFVFRINMPAPGTFAAHISSSAKAGARLIVSLDGKPVVDRAFTAAEGDTTLDTTERLQVPAGEHTIRLENTGTDWVVIDRFTLDPFVSVLAAVGKGAADYATFWVYRRQPSASAVAGRLTVPGLAPGVYRVAWWDTTAGKPLEQEHVRVGTDGDLSVPTPPTASDAAVVIRKVEAVPARPVILTR